MDTESYYVAAYIHGHFVQLLRMLPTFRQTVYELLSENRNFNIFRPTEALCLSMARKCKEKIIVDNGLRKCKKRYK